MPLMLADSTPRAAAFRTTSGPAQAGATPGTGRRGPGSRANKISGPQPATSPNAAGPGVRHPIPILRIPPGKQQIRTG